MARSEDFLSFEEALRELQLRSEELKKLVADGEIRAYRDGDSMKFRAEDLKSLMSGIEDNGDPSFGEGVTCSDVVTFQIGYQGSSDGFQFIKKPASWSPEDRAYVKRLAELDPQIVGEQNISRAYRFWGDFSVKGQRHALAWSFEAAKGRAGSFTVDVHGAAVAAETPPFDPQCLQRGVRALLDRRRHLRAVANMDPELRRAWLIEVVAVAVDLPGGCRVDEWRDAEHAGRLLSILPWSFGQKIEIVSSPAARTHHFPRDPRAYFDMAREPQARDLPPWVSELCSLWEQALTDVDRFAEMLAWLDTQPSFQSRENLSPLKGLSYVLRIRFRPEFEIEAGMQRVAEWIRLHNVPSAVRIELGRECVSAFMVAQAETCLPHLPACADSWKMADDGQGVAEELLTHLGLQVVKQASRPSLDLLRAIEALQNRADQSGARRLAPELARVFQRDAACSEGPLEEWVDLYSRVELGEHGVALRRRLVQRIWFEVDGMGWWQRRRFLRMRRDLGGPIDDEDLKAALRVSASISRLVFKKHHRRGDISPSKVMQLAVAPEISVSERTQAVSCAVGVLGRRLRRPRAITAMSSGVRGFDEHADLILRTIWYYLREARDVVSIDQMQRELSASPRLSSFSERLRQEMPVVVERRRWRAGWWLLLLGAVTTATCAYLWSEQVRSFVDRVGEQLSFGAEAAPEKAPPAETVPGSSTPLPPGDAPKEPASEGAGG